jgi:hypothetical protein
MRTHREICRQCIENFKEKNQEPDEIPLGEELPHKPYKRCAYFRFMKKSVIDNVGDCLLVYPVIESKDQIPEKCRFELEHIMLFQ